MLEPACVSSGRGIGVRPVLGMAQVHGTARSRGVRLAAGFGLRQAVTSARFQRRGHNCIAGGTEAAAEAASTHPPDGEQRSRWVEAGAGCISQQAKLIEDRARIGRGGLRRRQHLRAQRGGLPSRSRLIDLRLQQFPRLGHRDARARWCETIFGPCGPPIRSITGRRRWTA